MRRSRRRELLALLVALLLGWLVVYPLGLVLLQAIGGPGAWTLEAVRRFAREANEWRALWASLALSLASVVGAALVGVPLGVLTARIAFPGRRVVATLLGLPAVLPPLVGVLAFMFLYGETGFVARLVQRVGGLGETPWRLEGAGAVLLVHVATMYVYFYLFTRAGLAGLDPALGEAAASLGADRWRAFRRVTLPLLRPALAGAGLLVFMTSLASFSAPYIFGGGFRVMTTQITSTKLNGDDRLAMVETAALLLLALLGLALLKRSEGRRDAVGARKGVAPAPLRARPATRAVAAAVGWTLALVLTLPLATLVIVSLVPRGTWTVEALPPAYTLGNYRALLADPVRLKPILTSLWMAAAATAGALAIAIAVASLSRRKVRSAGLLEGLLALPWAVPGTVFAIALATTFSVYAPLTGRFVLVGTLWILPLAYLVRNLPLTGRAVLAGFRQLDPALEEAGASLGAGRGRVLRRITLPLLKPALAAGASLAFVTAFGDFVTSIMLYTYDTRPISMEILSSLRQADVGQAAAFGVVLMLLSSAVFFLAGEGRGTSG
ncbi:MAG TPA: iron ABC transporter permease [Gemmatimonadales bacterium]|jgi:iron(III) transport system permease protein|nr:iron ABC transporter permease [Gemmatimonadales bacterium]